MTSPGPWRWMNNGVPILLDANGVTIIAVEMGRVDDADARLIAAAPQLLHVVRVLLATLAEHEPTDSVAESVAKEVRALLGRLGLQGRRAE